MKNKLPIVLFVFLLIGMVSANAQNVGIDTTTPAHKLSVAGTPILKAF